MVRTSRRTTDTPARIGKKPVLIGLAAAVVLAAGGVTAVQVWPSSDDADTTPQTVPSTADRVLQAVTVTVGPRGSLTAVKGAVVGTTTDKSQFSFTKHYSPDEVAGQLPVRVLTSYRTADRSGTDLSDLDGYTGRVDISLTLQNLTQKAQQLSYDVGGGQRTQSALVGVPLTVVASTALPDLEPSAVVTEAGKGATATNGVLSQSAGGTTQVQWATILAPPQLGSSTTMDLAVDATDFKVPDFDISVQPGLVTDPSVGALLDSTFNPSGSSEMQLQQRTIDLISQVNTVLARAGKSMDRVRTTLGDSSKTLGTKTVTDLKGSTSGIADSMKELKGSLASLGQDLSTTLGQTKSTTLSELQAMVQTVDQMLGDTHSKAPVATVSGSGCDVSVNRPGASDSLYGNLLEVVSLLDGYSTATTGCKSEVQAQLLGSVGPTQPTATTCVGSTSVSCALFALGQGLNGFADQLAAQGDATVVALGSLKTQDLIDAVEGVDTVDPQTGTSSKQGGLVQAIVGLQSAAGNLSALPVISNGALNVDAVKAKVGVVRTALSQVHGVAAQLHQQAGAGATGASNLLDTNAALSQKICGLLAGGSLSPGDAASLRAYTSRESCPDAGGVSQPLATAQGSMEKQITDQISAWNDMATLTDDSGALGQELDDAGKALDEVDTALTALSGSAQVVDLGSAAAALAAALTTLNSSATSVSAKASTVLSQQADVTKSVSAAFDKAVSDTRSEAALDPLIRTVTSDAQQNSTELAALFDKSLTGLSSAGEAIAADGAKTIEGQKEQFAKVSKSSSKKVEHGITAGLGQVTQGVTSSTRDLGAAQTLLTKDLQDVLLDLGTRKVKGSGLLGAMATSTATANSANYQVALASDTAAAYANVRQGDINGLLLRQAQYDAGQQALAAMPAFGLTVPSSATHSTVYSFVVTPGS